MTDEDRHPAEWPHPNDRPCAECGHIWFVGERRHEYLDHSAESPEDVEVLCVLCRQQRGLAPARE
ncbi:MAG: hypothetical protein ACR2H2_08225 [Solirubrobacteraceae bacterium]